VAAPGRNPFEHRQREFLRFVGGAFELGDDLVDGKDCAQILCHRLALRDHLQRGFFDLGVIQIDLALSLQNQRGHGTVPARVGIHRELHLVDDQRTHRNCLHVQRRQVAVERACGVAFETQRHGDDASRIGP
jgi:hypothetical protein